MVREKEITCNYLSSLENIFLLNRGLTIAKYLTEGAAVEANTWNEAEGKSTKAGRNKL